MNEVQIDGTKIFQIADNEVDGISILADFQQIEERFYHLLYNNKSYNIELLHCDKLLKTYSIRVNSTIYEVAVKNPIDQLLSKMGFHSEAIKSSSNLKAPMPGMVLSIQVEIGQKLQKGDALVVLEAMKMENVLKASSEAVVKSIEIQKGQSVEKNEVLIIFE